MNNETLELEWAEMFVKSSLSIYELAKSIVDFEKFILVEIEKSGALSKRANAVMENLQTCNAEIIAVSKKYIDACDKMTDLSRKLWLKEK